MRLTAAAQVLEPFARGSDNGHHGATQRTRADTHVRKDSHQTTGNHLGHA